LTTSQKQTSVQVRHLIPLNRHKFYRIHQKKTVNNQESYQKRSIPMGFYVRRKSQLIPVFYIFKSIMNFFEAIFSIKILSFFAD
jgi:hypothetical protein